MELTINVTPFDRFDWIGHLLSLDGTSTADFSEDDLDEVIAQGSTPDDWDGEVAAVIRLKDGRYVAWETFWGPTGDGFSCAAYGGTADIAFASSLETAVSFGLTDEGRKLCGLS